MANRLPAASPSCNRYVECMFVQLAEAHRSPQKGLTRFQLIAADYRRVQLLIQGNPLMQKTLDLPDINEQMLRRW